MISFRTLHRNRAPLEVGSLYWELRDSVVNCELMMLRTLQFQVAFNNPHKVRCQCLSIILIIIIMMMMTINACSKY